MSEADQRDSILIWRKSSYSIANGACVEAVTVPGMIMIRDTVSPADGQLQFDARAWREFVERTKGA
jgi:Domain of unknown function (DUF397)